MDEDFVRERITLLRLRKGVSEYKMSLDLGHSKSYVQSITSGRALPSLSEFFFICDYFGITPKEFFDDSQPEPILLGRLLRSASRLSEADLRILLTLSERLAPPPEK